MPKSNRTNTDKWNHNSLILIKSRISKIHRTVLLRLTKFTQLSENKDMKLLDVGCGSGPFFKYFNKKGFRNLYGIEPDKHLAKNIPKGYAIEIKNCKAEKIDYKTGTFDAVFIYGVLHHLKGLEEYKQATAEIMRVLKPGGIVFIIEPGYYPIFRSVELGTKILAPLSKTFRALSTCMEDEETEQHFFIKNHLTVKKSLIAHGAKPIVDRYFLYSWIFTARKPLK